MDTDRIICRDPDRLAGSRLFVGTELSRTPPVGNGEAVARESGGCVMEM